MIKDRIDLSLQEIEKVADHSQNLKEIFTLDLGLAINNLKAAAEEERARRFTFEANLFPGMKANLAQAPPTLA